MPFEQKPLISKHESYSEQVRRSFKRNPANQQNREILDVSYVLPADEEQIK